MIPRNEMELIILFVQQSRDTQFEIVSAQTIFPDAIVKYREVEYKVEFEFKASNFWAHRHNPMECDLIICWENDDPYSVIPVIALDNPDWADIEIIIPSYQERTLSYWKARALRAEQTINEILDIDINEELFRKEKQIEKDTLLALARERKLQKKNDPVNIEQDNKFRELVENGISKRQASLIAYNRPYGGDIVKRGLMALASTTTTSSRNGSISTEK